MGGGSSIKLKEHEDILHNLKNEKEAQLKEEQERAKKQQELHERTLK
eukprot:CAMPEP_0184500098 /NCGR_PEP_ID=MMETSP0113_2-20130426/43637_1 /TAXON_ID=91329 /ORGANISM="Norrisiella sphaerica, Strain BC52" /LENGTH=46 /DNA_ID= /DNA_START= /DNA_END= /DNA_ORIENTATION=